MPIIVQNANHNKVFTGDNNRPNSGRVVVLEDQSVAEGQLMTVDNWAGFQASKAFFTRNQFAEQTNHQFSHTLGDEIFLYVFGDRLGELSLSGLAFEDNCVSSNRKIGVSHVRQFFNNYKLSRQPNPIRITLDQETVFECYLHSVQAAVIETSQRLYQFNLNFALLPDSANNGD